MGSRVHIKLTCSNQIQSRTQWLLWLQYKATFLVLQDNTSLFFQLKIKPINISSMSIHFFLLSEDTSEHNDVWKTCLCLSMPVRYQEFNQSSSCFLRHRQVVWITLGSKWRLSTQYTTGSELLQNSRHGPRKDNWWTGEDRVTRAKGALIHVES